MTEDEVSEYTKNYLEKIRTGSYPATAEYTNKLLDDIRIQSRIPTREDIIEIKKWMRLAITFPDKVHRYLPKFKKFCDNYGHMVITLDPHLHLKLMIDIFKELRVEPVNDKDFEFVAKGVIETIKKRPVRE